MPKLPTWDERSSFTYEGLVKKGTTIFYGQSGRQKVSPDAYRDLLKTFSGQLVNIGTSRDNPPPGSVGAWLKANVTKTAIASYVGRILIKEGYAEKVGRTELRFKSYTLRYLLGIFQ
jgi:hypothetical protein